jgi:putative transposase
MPQSLSNLLVHLVFSTKHRSPCLTPEVSAELFPYLTGILRNCGCITIQTGGVEDHIHLLFKLSRTLPIAQAVEKLKTSSSKWIKGKWADLTDFGWQGGYGAFSFSPREMDVMVRYVRSQEEHHRKTSFQEEFRKLLQEHGIEFDEKYVWD